MPLAAGRLSGRSAGQRLAWEPAHETVHFAELLDISTAEQEFVAVPEMSCGSRSGLQAALVIYFISVDRALGRSELSSFLGAWGVPAAWVSGRISEPVLSTR